MLDEIFVTGCDENTEWMLPWFIHNYKKYNNTPIVIVDFGMSVKSREWCKDNFHKVIDIVKMSNVRSWFMKPGAMIVASELSKKTCWIDTDCEVLGDISSIFNYTEPNKLSMCEDKPWIKRRNELWHNSGVVAFEGLPKILHAWDTQCAVNQIVGDQEVLHFMLKDPMLKMMNVITMPNKYNCLRLQIEDGMDIPDKLIMHWTGPKGKAIIKEKMNEEN